MKPAEKIKTQKILKKIQTGRFDENDIDNLFMKLRAYSKGFPVFREIADFVAHNDNRDRGLANQALETMYLSMKFFIEYNSSNRRLDLSEPFPLWVKRLMLLQIDKSNGDILKKQFNVTPERLKKRISKHFRSDESSGLAIYKKDKLSTETFQAIKYILSFISGNSAFTQEDLINQLLAVLKKNKIIFDQEKIRELSDRITLCVILLFHKTEFDIRGHKTAYCEIASEKESISHNANFVDIEGNPVEVSESFGKLLVRGTVTVKNRDRDLGISHCVMSTNLEAESCCAEELFHVEPLNEATPNHLCKRLDLNNDLTLDDDFRLGPLPS